MTVCQLDCGSLSKNEKTPVARGVRVDQRRLLVLPLKRVERRVPLLPLVPRTVLKVKPAARSCSGVAVAKLISVLIMLLLVMVVFCKWWGGCSSSISIVCHTTRVLSTHLVPLPQLSPRMGFNKAKISCLLIPATDVIFLIASSSISLSGTSFRCSGVKS